VRIFWGTKSSVEKNLIHLLKTRETTARRGLETVEGNRGSLLKKKVIPKGRVPEIQD